MVSMTFWKSFRVDVSLRISRTNPHPQEIALRLLGDEPEGVLDIDLNPFSRVLDSDTRIKQSSEYLLGCRRR